MKIGICVRTWGEKGGIGVYTRSLVNNLLSIDNKNEYCLFFNSQEYMGKFNSYENVQEINIQSQNKVIWDQLGVPYHAKKHGVDIIFHTKFTVPLFTRKKTAMVLHGSERLIYQKFHPKSDILYFKTVYPRYLKKASLILAVAERGRQDIIEKLGIDPEKIKTVHLAVDPLFKTIDDESFLKSIQEKYHLPQRFIVWVGHIYPGKNVGRLIKAFAEVRKKINVNLVLAGSKRWKFEKDLALLHELAIEEHVQILGHVPHEDLIGIYNLAELTAFPSYYESFPAIPLEANACGCPVVTSRTGGTPESAGNAAVYVDPLDVNDIAEAILRVLTDKNLRDSLIHKGFKNVKRFSWKKTARKTLEALESVCL